MKKQITLSLIVAFLFAMSVNLSAADVTIRFKAPVDWTTVNLYVYGTTEIMGGWPGRAVTKDADGFCSITYDNTGILTAFGIFNNGAGGQKTADFDVLATSCWEAKVLTGTVYSVGVVTCPNVTPEPVTVRFKAPVEWVDVYLYIWGTNNSLVGGWPGTKLTLGADGFYTATFDKAGISVANGIFNNNASPTVQAVDINVLDGGCFESTTLNADGKYVVVAATCPTTGVNELQQSSSLSVYPNPIKDKLNFATPENISRINIHSVTGENVMSVSDLVTAGAVDVTLLKSGIYFVNIHFVDGKQKTEKIIKL